MKTVQTKKKKSFDEWVRFAFKPGKVEMILLDRSVN